MASLILLLTFVMMPFQASAEQHRKPVTPYGDFCPRCSHYGICTSTMSHEEAKKAMIDYYNEKGYNVELQQKKGRFIKVKIKHKNNVVDVIIFDRQTGRIRSIY